MIDKAVRSWRGLSGALRFAPLVAVVIGLSLSHDAGAPTSATAAAPALPPPPANGEMGFVITQWHFPFATSGIKVDCPDGKFTSLKDDYLKTLPKVEADRLLEPANEVEFDKKWKAYARGPEGINICTNVYEFMDRPATPLMKGPAEWGLNLDNDDGGAGRDAYTCSHQNFTSPAGEKGVDNQIWRVVGCGDQYRGLADNGDSEHKNGYDRYMLSGEWTQVVLLRGVNSLVNDPDVEVIYANTDDRPVADSSGRVIQHASFSISTEGRKLLYRNVLHGRIVNGVLMTDPKDMLLSQTGGSGGARGQFDFQRARVRIAFQPDGTIKGMFAGYQPLLNLLAAQRGGGDSSATTSGKNCAGEFTALREMADGDKDPKTGKCRRISYAYEISGIPAFVNDVPGIRKIASK